jgi:hypothetical protein
MHTDSRNARPAGTRLAAVTDRGGPLVGPFAKAGQESAPGPGVLQLTTEESAAVIAMATRAPSLHNTQPWQFRLAGNAIELLADPDRWLRRVDRDGRELMISCGAALFGLRLGLRSLGLLPVSELLPDLAQPGLAARVRPAGHAAMNKVEAELVAAVPHRHTHRGGFAPGEVAARLLAALVGDAAAEGAELLLVDQGEVMDQLASPANTDRQEAGARPVLCGLAQAQRRLPLIMPEAAPANGRRWRRDARCRTRRAPARARMPTAAGCGSGRNRGPAQRRGQRASG